VSQAVAYFKTMSQAHPERHWVPAYRAAMAGERRKYPVLTINHLATPDDRNIPADDFELPIVNMADTPEGNLARDIVGLLEPLKMLNPLTQALPLGRGTGTYVASFGIPLDPNLNYTPAFTMSLDQALAIGQELPEGKEEEFIRRDLDRYADNPRLLFCYTGMHWRIKDRSKIRAIHRRLDAYWQSRYGA
jgi:hypothetical protein